MRRNRLLLSGAIAVVSILFTSQCARPTRTARAPSPDRPVVKVMTYNVNFGVPGALSSLDAIRSEGADVVFLQETTPEWELYLRAEFAELYPHMVFHHCCGAGGLAVLSRGTIQERGYLEPPEGGWFPAWRGVVATPLGPVQVLNVHLRPPASESGSFVSGYFSTPEVREREMAAYLEQLEPGLPTLVLGDLNEDRFGRAVRLLKSQGLTSVLPEFSPKQRTWRWPLAVGSLSGQLDHVAYDERLEPLEAKVIERGASDHFPLVAIFERAAR